MILSHRILNPSKQSRLQHRSLKTYAKYLLSAKECIKYRIDPTSDNDSKNLPVTPSVVIVGAGVAGLSAAVRLYKAGFDNVTILEATERPGGRIYSCWLGNTVAEIGAQWISGSSISNSVITLASQEGLLDLNTIYKYDYTGGTYMTSDGRPLSRALGAQAFLTFKQIEKQAYALYNLNAGRGSLMNFFSVRITQELHNFPANQREDAARIMFGLTNKVSNRWGTELTDLSAELFGNFTVMSGETVGIPLGFVGVLAPLIKEIPHCNIKYSKVVDRIQWSGVCSNTARAIITTCDLTEIPADYVIVTVSLGVLKSEAKTMFIPSLPKEKLEAIKMLGFGNISKIFVEYRKPFWIPRQGPIKFAWSMDELKKKDSWMKGLSSLEELPGSYQILMGTVSGKYADCVEKLGDMEVAENITMLLRQFTQDPTIPYPDSILRSKWRSSPFFMGANTYFSLESNIGHQKDLMTPVPEACGTKKSKCGEQSPIIPVIFFAGEATCPHFFSTVHGARLSGIKAAQDIIDLTVKLGGPPPKSIPKEEKDEDPCNC